MTGEIFGDQYTVGQIMYCTFFIIVSVTVIAYTPITLLP